MLTCHTLQPKIFRSFFIGLKKNFLTLQFHISFFFTFDFLLFFKKSKFFCTNWRVEVDQLVYKLYSRIKGMTVFTKPMWQLENAIIWLWNEFVYIYNIFPFFTCNLNDCLNNIICLLGEFFWIRWWSFEETASKLEIIMPHGQPLLFCHYLNDMEVWKKAFS